VNATHSELDRLLATERKAFERNNRLRGYPEIVETVALALWQEAKDAVRDYRAKLK
jgi:hypothetical protein